MMVSVNAPVGANGICADRIDIRQPHVIAAELHAVEMSGAGDESDADPCMARSCFRGKRCRWNLLDVDHQLGARADQFCSQARNYLSVALSNGLRPRRLKVAVRVNLASRPINTATRK
jgi:hypothetical protein